jgi:hypothetical protein
LWFSYEKIPVHQLPPGLAARLPADVLCYSFFIQQWLSELRLTARDVSLSWIDG